MPSIVYLPEPMLLAGVQLQVRRTRFRRGLTKLGASYLDVRDRVDDRRAPAGFAVVRVHAHPEVDEAVLFMGDVVCSHASQPQGIVGLSVPVGRYAVETVPVPGGVLTPLTLARARRRIKRWLPGAEERPATSGVLEFELRDARSLGPRPSVDLYVRLAD